MNASWRKGAGTMRRVLHSCQHYRRIPNSSRFIDSTPLIFVSLFLSSIDHNTCNERYRNFLDRHCHNRPWPLPGRPILRRPCTWDCKLPSAWIQSIAYGGVASFLECGDFQVRPAPFRWWDCCPWSRFLYRQWQRSSTTQKRYESSVERFADYPLIPEIVCCLSYCMHSHTDETQTYPSWSNCQC